MQLCNPGWKNNSSWSTTESHEYSQRSWYFHYRVFHNFLEEDKEKFDIQNGWEKSEYYYEDFNKSSWISGVHVSILKRRLSSNWIFWLFEMRQFLMFQALFCSTLGIRNILKLVFSRKVNLQFPCYSVSYNSNN